MVNSNAPGLIVIITAETTTTLILTVVVESFSGENSLQPGWIFPVNVLICCCGCHVEKDAVDSGVRISEDNIPDANLGDVNDNDELVNWRLQ